MSLIASNIATVFKAAVSCPSMPLSATHCHSLVFANLYYEFNNYLLDFVFSQQSNLKCAVYGDVQTAAEKTNFGGQQSYPTPAPLTYIQASSGYATLFANPPTPYQYELIYGPTGGANNAPGVSRDNGFPLLKRSQVNISTWALRSLTDTTSKPVHLFATPVPQIPLVECANTSISGAPLSTGLRQHIPAVWYVPSFLCVGTGEFVYNLRITQYYLVANPSTATNTGQGSLEVTYARGYMRQPLNPDGDFSGSDSAWITQSSSILHDSSLAHSGSDVGVVGTQRTPASGSSLGSITLARPLATHGETYDLQFFASARPTVSSTPLNGSTVSQVLWNDAVVATIAPQTTDWEVYTVSVTGHGNDVLSFVQTDGTVYTLIDKVSLFSSSIE